MICHSDTEGFYVAIRFDEVSFDADDRGLAGGILGSTQRLLAELIEEINRCGKDPDCTIREVYSVRFNCRLDLRGDGFELSRDHSEIETIEGIDTKLPRRDICDLLPIAGKHTLSF